MASRSFLLIASFFFLMKTVAQTTAPTYKPEDLTVQWEVVENNHQGKAEFLSAFTFVNKGAVLLSAGWKIYFNFPRTIVPSSVTGGVNIQQINGDFYQLSPAKDFKGMAPQTSLRIEFVSGAWAISISDAPAGLYLVWDAAPDKGFALSHYTVKPTTQPRQYMHSAADKVELATPRNVYEQNKNIADLPEAGLPKIFPTPAFYREGASRLALTTNYVIIVKKEDGLAAEKQYLADELKKLLKGEKKGAAMQIILRKDGSATDAYHLKVTPQNIILASGTNRGIFYGINP